MVRDKELENGAIKWNKEFLYAGLRIRIKLSLRRTLVRFVQY